MILIAINAFSCERYQSWIHSEDLRERTTGTLPSWPHAARMHPFGWKLRNCCLICGCTSLQRPQMLERQRIALQLLVWRPMLVQWETNSSSCGWILGRSHVEFRAIGDALPTSGPGQSSVLFPILRCISRRNSKGLWGRVLRSNLLLWSFITWWAISGSWLDSNIARFKCARSWLERVVRAPARPKKITPIEREHLKCRDQVGRK